ncbi:MAG: precorrin-6Y C5,15-methyltransferase (decarboxylating) subunit CbiT, partial [Coriobacteriia bacterium]|nr:precorrin-6Y C5,15-methyltransferase (decarboxylating) subunit CbiT [Coriobacteriia bacterium]
RNIDAFERLEHVPITKAEVRAVILSKLQLKDHAIVWDVGAGSGSVGLEALCLVDSAQLFAFEKQANACALIEANARRLKLRNYEVIEGFAPESFSGYPSPSHVFIGGSSGALDAIFASLKERKHKMRIVVSATTLQSAYKAQQELQSDAYCNFEMQVMTVSRAHKLGTYTIMQGENPVYIISADLRLEEEL